MLDSPATGLLRRSVTTYVEYLGRRYRSTSIQASTWLGVIFVISWLTSFALLSYGKGPVYSEFIRLPILSEPGASPRDRLHALLTLAFLLPVVRSRQTARYALPPRKTIILVKISQLFLSAKARCPRPTLHRAHPHTLRCSIPLARARQATPMSSPAAAATGSCSGQFKSTVHVDPHAVFQLIALVPPTPHAFIIAIRRSSTKER